MPQYYWLSLGVVLCVLEMLVPGFFLFWFGISTLAVGAVLFLVPEASPVVQVLLFSVFTMSCLLIWQKFFRYVPSLDAETGKINQIGLSQIGKILTLTSDISNGRGHIFIGDTRWSLSGPDLPQGTKVEVLGIDGMALKVARTDK